MVETGIVVYTISTVLMSYEGTVSLIGKDSDNHDLVQKDGNTIVPYNTVIYEDSKWNSFWREDKSHVPIINELP